ncbi:MAG: PaaI family thioesterase [Actinomycetota bacterium]|nr:PaaI family thioesterase [Actinomycetota bacterium]
MPEDITATSIERLVTEGFTGSIGLQVQEASGDRIVMRWKVEPTQWQPYGITHGGVYCTVVETVASLAGALWLGADGQVVGVSNHTDFLRAVREGELTATGTPIHRGRLQQLWLVEVHDEQDRLVARGQVRLQNLRSADQLARA